MTDNPYPENLYPENLFERYHAHIYFDETSESEARELCIGAWQLCHVGLGRFHTQPIGPHTAWSCQLSFDNKEFDRLVPWLDANSDNLSILVHPLAGDAYAEHSSLARWLGRPLDLDLSIFQSD